jgi:riboflavin synthase
MGGHFVQGHVDTIATVLSVTPDGAQALVFRLRPREPDVLRYIVEKGYITLDGASLTVTAVKDGQDGWWEVMLIPYTQGKVVTAAKKAGDEVNVEVDTVAKYVERSVAVYLDGKGAGETPMLERMIARMVDDRLKTMRI